MIKIRSCLYGQSKDNDWKGATKSRGIPLGPEASYTIMFVAVLKVLRCYTAY